MVPQPPPLHGKIQLAEFQFYKCYRNETSQCFSWSFSNKMIPNRRSYLLGFWRYGILWNLSYIKMWHHHLFQSASSWRVVISTVNLPFVPKRIGEDTTSIRFVITVTTLRKILSVWRLILNVRFPRRWNVYVCWSSNSNDTSSSLFIVRYEGCGDAEDIFVMCQALSWFSFKFLRAHL